MIICTKCSTHNADDDEFCGGCGEFLEWAGQRVTSPDSAPAPAPEPEPEPAPAPEQASPPEPDSRPEPPAPPKDVTAPPPVPVPPEPVQPPPVQPAAVLPTRPVPQRAEPAQAAKAEPALRPGESPCPSCGAGNEADRAFCRRCGTSLEPEPEGEKKPSWWRKLVTKDPPKPRAGERPMRDKKGKFKP